MTRVLLSIAELYRTSQCHTIALPILLKALALSREYRLQHLASETVLNLAFSQVLATCVSYKCPPPPPFMVGASLKFCQGEFSLGGQGFSALGETSSAHEPNHLLQEIDAVK